MPTPTKPVHAMILGNQATPPIARKLYEASYLDAALPANSVKVTASLSIDCDTGWVVGHDEHGNLISGRLAVFERAVNPTLPTQTAVKTWPI